MAPDAQVNWSGEALPFPMNLSDAPVHAYLGDYGTVPLEAGIKSTYDAFRALLQRGLLSAANVG